MSDYTEFLNTLQKKGSKPHTISHCMGSRDAWKWIRKNKWKELGNNQIDELTYSKVVSNINRLLAEKLLEGHEIEFPYQMGSLQLTGNSAKVEMTDKGIKTNYRTDWKKTLKLWYEDDGAKNSHIIVKKIASVIYSIMYFKDKAKYCNKRFYSFRINRSLSKSLGSMIEKGKVNAVKLD